MPRQLFLVLTNAEPGREDEYNAWHNAHLADVLKVPGIVSGQRFRVSGTRGEHAEFNYLALYVLNTENPSEVIREIEARATSGGMVVSSSMSPNLLAACYSSITDTDYSETT